MLALHKDAASVSLHPGRCRNLDFPAPRRPG